MADVTIDLEVLNLAINPDLGEVQLNPTLSLGETEPTLIAETPEIMLSPALVPNANYRFVYNQVRYLKMGYLLQRDGEYESGEIDIISNAIKTANTEVSLPYIPPTLTFSRSMIQQTAGDLGVDLGVEIDSISVPLQPSFGITFQITTDVPDVFPTLRIFIIKLLPL